MFWVLLLIIHAGSSSGNDDVAVNSIRFYQQNACEAAGDAAKSKLRWTQQSVDYVCIHDSGQGS